jgi:hypothetical protein
MEAATQRTSEPRHAESETERVAAESETERVAAADTKSGAPHRRGLFRRHRETTAAGR